MSNEVMTKEHVWFTVRDKIDEPRTPLKNNHYRYIQESDLWLGQHSRRYYIETEPAYVRGPLSLKQVVQMGKEEYKNGLTYQQPSDDDYRRMGVPHVCKDCTNTRMVALPEWMIGDQNIPIVARHLATELTNADDRIVFVRDRMFKHIRMKYDGNSILSTSSNHPLRTDGDFCTDAGSRLIKNIARVEFLLVLYTIEPP